MLIGALATDYDGTLATHSDVDEATVAALRRLKASGRKLVMVTGRELPDLMQVFPHLDLFDSVVVENGALLYRPATQEARALAPPPPAALVAELARRQVQPLNAGQVIVATGSGYEAEVRETIDALGLPWRAILNKDSIMCLPAGVDKASGLRVAAAELGLDLAEVLAVGDAENDLAFFAICGVSAAVANALPDVKAAADIVTEGEAGAGVTWLIDRVLEGSLLAEETVFD